MSNFGQRMAELRLADAEKRLLEEKRKNEMLKARLEALDADVCDDIPDWAEGLRPAQVALMEAFLSTYPRVVTVAFLEELIPKRDHVVDRCDKIVEVYIHHLRKVFGKTAIVNVWGKGYRLSPTFYETISKKKKA